MLRRLIGTITLGFMSHVVSASDLEDLARHGYAVVSETAVRGEFEGCEFDKRIVLENGLTFICETYNYNYDFSPEVLILKHIRTEDVKVIIGDDEYDGRLVQGR